MNYRPNKNSPKKNATPLLTPTNNIYDSIDLSAYKKASIVYTQNSQCIVCNKPTKMNCSRCLRVYYCGKEHQRMHWLINSSFD